MNRAAAPALEPAPNRFYLPELDSLRFFAFLGVFIAHVSPISSLRPLYALPIFAAGFGVDLFFTLSAFLITELLMREKERFGSLNVGAFYTRRILRIWPLYFTYVAAVFCAQWIYPAIRVPAGYYVSCVLFVANFGVAWWFRQISYLLGPLWSISIEEQFYLSWPWVARRLNRRGVAIAGIALWALSICVRCAMVFFGVSPAMIRFGTLSRLDPIACGLVLPYILGRPSGFWPTRPRLPLSLLGAALWLIAAAVMFIHNVDLVGSLLIYPLAALGCAAFLLSTIGASTWMRSASLIYLGRISYGLYVFHGAGLAIAEAILGDQSHGMIRWAVFAVLSLSLTIAMASVSYRWLETPFLQLKCRFQRVPSQPQ